jgi:uncharacterized membrane protein YheB (UPF0754 family)
MLYLLIPLLSAGIGWFTNWVAIKMLFQPRNPRRFLGLTWQGLIPSRQHDLAQKTAEILDRELVTQDWLKERFSQIDLSHLLEDFTRTLVRDRLVPRLKGIPLVGSFISDSTVDTFEKIAIEEISRESSQITNKLSETLPAQLQIRTLMAERIEAFEIDRLERIVREVARREFQIIERLGALLGFTIGCLQLLLLALLR